ncbi:OTU-like cysteine protease [Seiridium cupressi]
MEPEPELLKAMQARHRKEQRDLQSRVTSKKKNATKKTRKGVNDECAELERQLKERQGQELAVLSGQQPQDGDEEPDSNGFAEINESTILAEKLQDTSISNVTGDDTRNATEKQEQAPDGKKRNRQQERMARRRAEQEAAAAAAEEEANNMTDHRAIEKTYLLKEFKANQLVEKEIQPDGHCLFSAVADQLSQQNIPLGGEAGQPPYKVVRRKATDYMQKHKDDFAPFLEDDFEDYVKKIRDTAEWGGQLELKALADVYGVEIKVLQDGRTETIEPGSTVKDGDASRIWLAYYRHGYGLGEHYNSLRKAAS